MMNGGNTVHTEWLHDDYLKAWKVDSEGRAQNLHFAEPADVK